MKKFLLSILILAGLSVVLYFIFIDTHIEETQPIPVITEDVFIDIEPTDEWLEPERLEEPGEPTGEITTRWIYEKSDVYGGYGEDIEYALTAEELENLFKDITFEIFQGLVCYQRNNCIHFKEEEYSLESYFSSKLGEEETPEQIRAWFKETFDVELEENVYLYDMSGQPSPLHRMIIFPNKILMFIYGAFYASFIPTDYAETSFSRTYYADMETFEVMTFPGKTIRETYSSILSLESHLNEELPLENIEFIHEDEVSVNYNWESPEQLTINISYPGGDFQFKFTQTRDYTQVITHSMPD